jgi:hypothetical protein
MTRAFLSRLHPAWLFYFLPYALVYVCNGFLGHSLASLAPLTFFLSFLCLFFLPGFAACSILLARRNADIWEWIGCSVLLSLFLYCAICLVCSVLAFGLRALEGAYVLTALAAGGVAVVKGKGRWPPLQAARVSRASFLAVLLLLLSMSLILGLSQGGIDTDWDSLDHLAYVRQILIDESIEPSSVLHQGPDGIGTDPRKGFLHALIAIMCRWSGIDPVTAWFWLPVVLGPLVGLMFFLFARQLTDSTAISVLSTSIFFVLYPEGNPLWFNGIAIPGRFCVGIVWLGFALYLRYVGRSRRTDLALASVSGFVLLAIHLPSFFLFFGGCMALALACVWKRHLTALKSSGLVVSLLVLLASSVPVLVWRWISNGPAVNPVHTHLHGVLFVFDGLYIAGVAELSRWLGWLGWLAVIASFFLPRLTGGHRSSYFLVALTACSLFVAVNPFIAPLIAPKAGYLTFRTLRVIPYALVLACLLVGLVRLARGRCSLAKRIVTIVTLLMVAAIMVGRLQRFVVAQAEAVTHKGRVPYEWLEGLEFLSGMNSSAVIASDPVTSYTIAGLTHHKVVAVLGQHGPPNDPTGLDRLIDQRRIMSPYTTIAETVALMERHGARIVFVNQTSSEPRHLFQYSILPSMFVYDRSKFEDFPEVFTPLWSGDDQWVFALREDVTTTLPNSAVLSPATVDTVFVAEAETECDSVKLLAHRFESDTVSRNSTLAFDIFWEKTSQSSSQLPHVLIVRFDHEVPKGILWNKGYGRLYRKMLEFRSHARYRFRRNLLPAHGVFRTQDWEPGTILKDRYEIWIPDDIHPGRYTVRMKLVQFPLLLNLRLSDIFQDDDYFRGAAVDTLEMR